MFRLPHRALPGESWSAKGITTDSVDSTSFRIGSQTVYDFLADGKTLLAVVGPSSRDLGRALSIKSISYQVRRGFGIGLSPKELSFDATILGPVINSTIPSERFA
jgi:hypothetical protein